MQAERERAENLKGTMTKLLHISDTLSLPLDAVTQTFGILAIRGAGKSNTAAVMAEQMFAAHLPFVVVDPHGTWWGLRSSADGKGAGLAIPIFGGKKADVPLESTGGALIADVLVDERLSCVLDISEFGEGEKMRFLAEFAQRLYRRNEQPLHLFLEEADDYIPQKPGRNQLAVLGAFENIVRRGRARGLGITMITQRSAVINKNVLTQIETLIVMRTTSPQDRKSIEAWVDYYGQSRELINSLPSLENGEAWVWSPHALKILERVKINRRATFDSAATPKELAKRPAATLADIDLGAIRVKMEATIERAKAQDPKELRLEVARLKKLLDAKPIAEAKIVEVPVLSNGKLAEMNLLLEQLSACGMTLIGIGEGIKKSAEGIESEIARVQLPPAPQRTVASVAIAPRAGPDNPRRIITRTAEPVEGGSLENTCYKILNVLATLDLRNIRPTKETIARWLGIHPNGGRYNKNLAALRAQGYIEGFDLTALGKKHAVADSTGLEAALAVLPEESMRNVLRAVCNAESATKDEIAERLGIHPNGGRFNKHLAWLRTMGVITERGPIQPTDGLFN